MESKQFNPAKTERKNDAAQSSGSLSITRTCGEGGPPKMDWTIATNFDGITTNLSHLKTHPAVLVF
jgi:hypothetical protein